MIIPSTYPSQAEASAADVPREVIANLLTRMLPRTPVSRRRVEPEPPRGERPYVVLGGEIVALSPQRDPTAPLKKPRIRRIRKYNRSDRIVVTGKGHAKLRKFSDTLAQKNLAMLAECARVGDALARGLKPSDINYADKVGTINVFEEGMIR